MPPSAIVFKAFAVGSLAQSEGCRFGGGRGLARILVTGAAGFVGRALCRGLAGRGHSVIGLTRATAPPSAGIELRAFGEIGPRTDWSEVLTAIDVVVHLATRAHRRLIDQAPQIDEAEAAAGLARAAAAAGVKRFVHMSSIRAIGEATAPGAPFRPDTPPQPRDKYGRAKLAIERALLKAARECGPELVILRPPLVYGPGVKANFRALIGLAGSGLPLPFAGVDNRRSLIFLDNFVDLTASACIHPSAAGRILLARDAVDLATPDLLRALAAGLDRRIRLFAVPPTVFAALRALPPLGPLVARLTLSLQVDDSTTRRVLGWASPVAPEPALMATARTFRRSK